MNCTLNSTTHNLTMTSPQLKGESQASLLLKKQLKELTKNPVEGFSAGLVDDSNIFEWEVGPMVSVIPIAKISLLL